MSEVTTTVDNITTSIVILAPELPEIQYVVLYTNKI